MPGTPAPRKRCPDCKTPLPPSTRKTYCEADGHRRRTESNAKNAKAWRQRQAEARTARQIAAKGRVTRTPAIWLDGSTVVELKLLLADLIRSHHALAERDQEPFPFMAELHDHVLAVRAIAAKIGQLVPPSVPSPEDLT